MKIKKSPKTFLCLIIVILISVFSTSQLFAATDVSLEDDTENSQISINVNSNEESLVGIDMTIIYSEDITINDVINTEDYCTLSFNSIIGDNSVSIECLNSSLLVINQEIVIIDYSTTSESYYFYINEDIMDIGSSELGEITHINKPKTVTFDTKNTLQTTEETIEKSDEVPPEPSTLSSDIATVVVNNLLCFILGLILLILLAVFIILVRKYRRSLANKN